METDKVIEKLRFLYGFMLPNVKRALEEDGGIGPTIFGLTADGEGLVQVLKIENPKAAPAAYQEASKNLREVEALGAVMFNNVLYCEAEIDSDGEADRLPSDGDPSTKEALTALLITYGWSEAHLMPLTRIDNKVNWNEPELMDVGVLSSPITTFDVTLH